MSFANVHDDFQCKTVERKHTVARSIKCYWKNLIEAITCEIYVVAIY